MVAEQFRQEPGKVASIVLIGNVMSMIFIPVGARAGVAGMSDRGGYPMSARIEALLFDLGGVLIEVVGVERMLQWCPALPDTEALWRRWLASPSVRSYETGNATRREFARRGDRGVRAAGRSRTRSSPSSPGGRAGSTTTRRPLLDALKPRFRLASLSNTNELHWERFSRDWNLPAYFHANFPSYAVGRLKPDADYFEHVLDTLGVAPAARAVRRRQRDQRRRGRAARHRRAAARSVRQGVRAVLAELKLDA